MILPLIGSLGTPELLLIFAVVVLLFDAKKLPELARGSGRALRIFKAETKGLVDDDDETTAPPAAPRAIPPGDAAPGPVAAQEVPPAERKPDSAD